MRIAAALLLTFTVSCTTDYTGLNAGAGGFGGTSTSTGKGGWMNVGGAAGMAATGGVVGTGGVVATGGVVGTGGVAGGGGAPACCPTGGMGGAGGTTVLKAAGMACSSAAECATGFCADGVCCENACTGACVACSNAKTGQGDGNCRAVPAGLDPDAECPATAQGTCGSTGQGCDGTGQCKKWPAGTVCDATPKCDSTGANAIPASMCNGAGVCAAVPPVSCNGFACSAGACETTCSADTDCAAGAFCSAHTCIGVANLAGNGDLETGTTTGWEGANGLPAPQLSSKSTGGYAHAGAYSIAATNRTVYYQGPGYTMPTGRGQYQISAWVMQADDLMMQMVPQIRVICADLTSAYLNVLSNYQISTPANTWTHVAGVVDTGASSSSNATCLGDTGAIKSAVFYVIQPDPAAGVPPVPNVLPDIYVDDLVIQATDGHNLIGNPNFEGGWTSGWSTTGGSSTLGASNSFAHEGQYSLRQSARTMPTSAITYALPIGAARYAVSFWVLQDGTTDHQLGLLPLYSCIGSSTSYYATPSAPVVAHAGQWTQVTGTFVFPPPDAPAGCVLSQASVALGQGETGDCGSTLECPDLYVDDASITLK